MSEVEKIEMSARLFRAPNHGEPWLVLIGCGKEKRETPAPVTASSLYTGPLFRARRAFAEGDTRPWMIVSAHYGIIAPHEPVLTYDKRVDELTAPEMVAWADKVRARIVRYFEGFGCNGKTIELHAGAAYYRALRAGLHGLGITIVCPMEGKGIGAQLAAYRAGYRRPVRLADYGATERAHRAAIGDCGGELALVA
jgi:hypothetical protein